MNPHPDDDTELATYGMAFKEYARNYGMERPEQAWVLTPWDTWEANPCYQGPKVRHPEYDPEDYDETSSQIEDEGPLDWGF